MRKRGFTSTFALVLYCLLLASRSKRVRPGRKGSARERWRIGSRRRDGGPIANGESVVKKLDGDAIPALIDALDSDEERLAQGAVWVLCLLSYCEPEAACARYDTQAQILSQGHPYYPFDAFGKHVEGTVTVRILIDASGHVAHSVVSKSVKMLDASALHCVRSWTFRPAMRGDRPIPSVARAPVTFRITGKR